MELMKSLNFEYLRDRRPELADLGAFAEQYVYADPESALVKLRTFAETAVLGIYQILGFEKPIRPSFIDLLLLDQFQDAVPKPVLDKLHMLRKEGNTAAHGGGVKGFMALQALHEAFDIGRWIHITFHGGTPKDFSNFEAPPKSAAIDEKDLEKLKSEKDSLRRRLQDKEAQMTKLLDDLEKARSKAEAVSAEKVEVFLRAGQGAANELKFDEATTRSRLIDAALVEAGWDVGPNGEDTEEVSQEQPVPDDTAKSGERFVDYVLWGANGEPLAVVEAKKTSVSEERGRKQAQMYADALEKEHGLRPVIFYTNGFRTKIWNDAMGEPPRPVYGIYDRAGIERLIHMRRDAKKQLDNLEVKTAIINRDYQLEAVKRVGEKFQNKHRKSLIVLATGTGKTRVAIALTELLISAGWVKNVLFLCDRKELRKQARNAFQEFSKEPVTIVGNRSSKNQDDRIFLATYPGMMKYYQRFNVGFFDLIIADESHRSIYNRYRELFQYFDALQVGLTATPVRNIDRNTYDLFGCEDQDPTAHYSYDEAIRESWLCPFEVQTFTTEFLRQGIKYDELTPEQQQQLEEDEEEPGLINYDRGQVDRAVLNRDTNRLILDNLMNNGIKDPTGSYPGKTIIFARNHNHAVLLQQVFEERYPQYGGNFCCVIDNKEPRAEQLIDDFKGEGKRNDVQIAISVDMLDTGVDVPEIVNLVFAKPVRSYVKFWQMIGRGTRLCKDLFGLGQHKEKFIIFDHWGNFEFFDEHYVERNESRKKSLLQLLFESRVSLAELALEKQEGEVFDLAVDLILRDIKDLPEKSIAVRDHWREVKTMEQEENVRRMDAASVASLRNDIAPLMQWRNIRGRQDAYDFDYLVSLLKLQILHETPKFEDLKFDLLDRVARLPIRVPSVREQEALIKEVRTGGFWKTLTISKLEEVRQSLRGLMQYLDKRKATPVPPKELDIKENVSRIEASTYVPQVGSLEERAYRKRVEEVLNEMFESIPVLKKIKAGEKVQPTDLDTLCSLVLAQHPDVDLKVLKEFYPEAADLDYVIRTIIGLDASFVEECFQEFMERHTTLNARQLQFMRLLKNHISKYGVIEVGRLYEDPFTQIDSDGLDGIFENEDQIEDLIAIIDTFRPANGEETTEI